MSFPPGRLGPGPRTTLRRRASRADYDQVAIHALIDECFVCHVGFVQDGEPRVLPMAFAREASTVYLHGARGNAMLAALLSTPRCCLSFTLLDGLVFAKSAIHHSMNYRSVVAFGTAAKVEDVVTQRHALELLLDHVAPGRRAETRAANEAELRSTTLLAVTLDEASLKARSGPSRDDPEDLPLEHYAGVVPLRLVAGSPTYEDRSSDVSASVRARAEQLGALPVVEEHRGELLLSSDPARIDLPYVHAFLRDESYWVPGIDVARVQESVERSVCAGLYRSGRQIGFGRAITDGTRFAYLADIFVDRELRGRGLGRALVEFLLRLPEVARVDRVLLGTRDAHALYRELGFEDVEPGRLMSRSR